MRFSYKSGVGILLISIAVICAGCMQSAQSGSISSTSYSNITAQEARTIKHASEGNLVIIDLSANYMDGHLPMAINIPLNALDAEIPTLDRSKPYLVYGHNDNDSIAGAAKLGNAGFSPVYRLKGNYDAWVSAGYPGE